MRGDPREAGSPQQIVRRNEITRDDRHALTQARRAHDARQTLKAARWTSHRSPSPRRRFAPSVFISHPDHADLHARFSPFRAATAPCAPGPRPRSSFSPDDRGRFFVHGRSLARGCVDPLTIVSRWIGRDPEGTSRGP